MRKIIKGMLLSVFLLGMFTLIGVSNTSTPAYASSGTTVSGTVYSDTEALLDQKWMKLRSTGVYPQWYNVWVSNGLFTVNLPDGSYQADEYWDDAKNDYIQLDKSFTVTGNVYTPDPLEIHTPAPNISGTLDVDGNKAINQAWLYFHQVGSTQKNFTSSINNGIFKLYLPAGTYHLDGIWSSQEYIGLNQTFTVTSAYTNLNPATWELKASQKIKGTLTYSDNVATSVHSAWINFSNTETNQWYSTNVTDGKFSVRLSDGSYKVEGFWDQTSQEYTQLTKNFTVANGILTSPLDVKIPVKNVTGTLHNSDETNVAKAWLHLRSVSNDPNEQHWYNSNVIDGSFSIALPDGVYQIDGFWDEGTSKDYRLYDSFTVSNGVLVGKSSLTLKLPLNNVHGTLKVDNIDVNSVWLNLHTADMKQGYGFEVKNGSFDFFLPDGTYELDGYWDESVQNYVRLNGYTFTITGGKSDHSALNVILNRNVSGTLKYNDLPVEKAWLNLHSINNNKDNQGMNAHVKDGRFSLSLNDGDYQVDGYWDEKQAKQVQYTYKFSVVNGVSNPSVLSINVPADNVNGTVKNADGGYVTRGNLNLNSNSMNPGTGQQGYNTFIDNGKFSLYLPDGSYQIKGFWSEDSNDYVQLENVSFQVNNHVQDTVISLQAPSKNVSGTLYRQLDNGKVLVKKAWLNLHSETDQGQFNQWYNASVTNGAFSIALPAGTYMVDGFWEEETNEYTQINKRFTVSSSGQLVAVDLPIPKKNVSGTLTTADKLPIDGVMLNLHSEGTQGWHGYSASVKEGQFSLYLPDGNYKIEGFWDQKSQDQVMLNYSFTVQNGISLPNPLQVVVQNKNVFGTLKDSNGSAVASAWLSVHSTDMNSFKGYSVQVKEGVFSLYLPDGNYISDGYWDVNKQERVNVQYPFKVSAGQSNPAQLEIVIPKSNVFGTLKKEDGTMIDNVELTLHSENKDSSANFGTSVKVKQGQFSLYLPDGNYVVDGFFDPNNGKQQSQFRYNFNVVNGQSTPNPLVIVMMKDNVQGTLKSQDGTAVDQVSIHLHSIGTASSPGIGYNINVNNGQFSAYLPDGNYQTEGFYNQNTQEDVPLRVTFSVTNGVSNPNPLQLVVMNPNVSGTITKKGVMLDGIYLSLYSNGTLNTPGFGTSMKVKDGHFKLYLPDGDYTIDSYWDQATQQQVKIKYPFKVSNGQSSPNPLNIQVMDSNVFGTVVTSDGTSIGSAYLSISDGSSSESFGVNVRNGKFDSYLPDGDYQIGGMSLEGSKDFVTLTDRFSVKNGSVSTSPNPLVITIRNNNVTGTLNKPDGNPVENGWLFVEIPGIPGQVLRARVTNGIFKLYLPDGNYSVNSARDERAGQLTAKAQFSVSNGVLTSKLTIASSAASTTGTAVK